jgi:hypothetical protein
MPLSPQSNKHLDNFTEPPSEGCARLIFQFMFWARTEYR